MKNIDERIEDLRSRNKGRYVTQGVSFNKESDRQMALLKFALENSDSFSGLVKEMLARMLDNGGIHHNGVSNQLASSPQTQSNPKLKDIGNFL